MVESNATGSIQIDVKLDSLYQEDIFTDLGAVTVRRLRPVTKDGNPDPKRRIEYTAETTLATQFGTLPVQAPIEATTLAEAFAKFQDAVQQEIEQLQERAKELRREENSRIVVPTATPSPPSVGGRPPRKLIFGK